MRRVHKARTGDVQVVNPFSHIETEVTQSVASGNLPTLADLTQLLAATDETWHNLLLEKQPTSYVDLANSSNSVIYLQSLSQHQGVIAIEDPLESKILKKTKELWQPTADAMFAGLYIHPNVIVADESKVYGDIHDLYCLKPYPTLQIAKQIMRANSHI
ncbi:MAG: hypothetical protein ACEQSA_02040 [Weeksellaceae bacterium]